MKVLIICNCASGLYDFRGMLIKELKKNHDVAAIIPITEKSTELEAETGLEQIGCRLLRVQMERRGMNPVKDLALMKAYRRIIKQENPDLVITYTVKANAYGGIVCRLMRVPYAANITGLGTAFQGNGMLRKFVTALYKIAFKDVKVVFFENEENRQILVDAGAVDNRKTHVLMGAGVNVEEFQVTPYPADCAETRFLFIGRIMEEKGVNELFCVMKRLNEEGTKCFLDILGSFDEDYEDKINEYEDAGWLKFWGYQTDVRPFIEKSHCFVLPSWHEGMANTNLECAASGRPVITSNIHGCLEAVEDGVTGYLCERQNADDLYRVMKKMCRLSYEERKAMGLIGRRRMEEIFDKRKVVEETIKQLL